MSSARTTTRNAVSPPPSIGRPPRSRMLQQPSQLRARLTEPGADTIQVLLVDAGRREVALNAAVEALELAEDAEHRARRGLGDALQSRELLFGLRSLEPRFVPRAQALLAERVVGGDLLVGDADNVQQQGGQETGAVLPTDAMDDHAALRRAGYRAHAGGDVRLEALEEDDVDVARRGRDVRRCGGGGLDLRRDLVPLLLVRLHEGDVDDGHGQLAWWILLALVVAAQVDDRSDPVPDECLPACVRQLADAVGADDGAEFRLAAVAHWMPAEVADVETAVPDEGAVRRQLQRARRLEASSRLRPGSRPEPARREPPSRRSSRSCCGGGGPAGGDGWGAAAPEKFTVVLRRVRPRRSDWSVRLRPSTSTSSTRPMRSRLRFCATR